MKESKEGKLGAYAMKRVAAGAHVPAPWLFEPAKRPDDGADYCLGYNEASLVFHGTYCSIYEGQQRHTRTWGEGCRRASPDLFVEA